MSKNLFFNINDIKHEDLILSYEDEMGKIKRTTPENLQALAHASMQIMRIFQDNAHIKTK